MKINKKKILKYIGIFLLGLMVILILATLSLRLSPVQNFVKNKVVNYVQDKIGTPISLDHVYVNFPNHLELKNFYVEGQKKDTILFVDNLDVGLNIPQLLDNKAEFSSIDLNGLVAFIERNKEGEFNFDYIINEFAADDNKNKESKPFIIDLDAIKLKNIRVIYDDRITKNNLNIKFNAFETTVEKFDLNKNSYDIGNIHFDGLKFTLKQDIINETSEKVKETADSLSQQNPLQINLKDIELTNFDIDYQDDNSKTYAKVKFKELLGKIKNLDVQKNNYLLGNLKLSEADIVANLELPTSNSVDKEVTNVEESPFNLGLDQVSLNNINLVYNNTAAKKINRGLDYNHLSVSNLHFKMNDFVMDGSSFKGKIKKGSFIEQSDLVLKELKTDFVYTNNNLILDDLLLKTQNTILRDKLVLNYSDLDELSNNTGKADINLNLENSKVGFKDILILAPDLINEKIFQKYPNATLYIDSKINGKIDNLNIEKLSVSGLDDFKLIANGNIENATNPDNLYFDLDVNRLSAKAKTIYNVTPAGTIPKNISLPRTFTANGEIKGSTNNLYTNIKVTSSDGNASIVGTLDLRQENQEIYDLLLETNNLNIGKIIKNPSIGKVSSTIDVKGHGFDLATARANINAKISKAVYNGYNYSKIVLAGELLNSDYDFVLNSNDPNANLSLRANGVYSEVNPNVQINGEIIKVDLQKLNFYNDALIIAGSIKGEFKNFNPDELNGNLVLKDFAISDTKDVYPLADAHIKVTNTEELNSINIKSQVLDLKLEGNYQLTEISKALKNTINQYYLFSENFKGLENFDQNQYFVLKAKIKDDDLLRKFVPDLKSFQDITVDGSFNAQQNKIDLAANIPYIDYGGNIISDAFLNISNNAEKLIYELNANQFKSGNYAINFINLDGFVQNNNINYNLSTKTKDEEVNYLIGGIIEQSENSLKIRLNQDGLILNKEKWQVSENNQIQLFENGMNAQNFELSNANRFIRLHSESPDPKSTININIQDLKIEDLTNIIEQDTLIAQGKINADINVSDLYNDPLYAGNLDVSNLKIYNSPVGNLAVNLDQSTVNKVNLNAKLTGFDNNLRVNGYYDIANSSMDLNAEINKLNIESIQGFSFNEIKGGKGYLSGNLDISGRTSSPSIIGKIKFNDVGMRITQIGTAFHDINDEVIFNSNGIVFNRFTIADEDANTIVLDGVIKTSTYQDFNFDLNLTSEDFKVVNAERNDESMVYGVVSLGADLRITGDLDLPIVSGNLSIDKPTDFTFILPSSSPSLEEREGVVEFIDQDQIVLNSTIENDTIDSTSRIKGLDVNVNISVEKEALVSIIIDQATGDLVKIQGSAELNGGIDPSGKTTLSGVYEVDDGAYQLNVNMLERKFDIQKGSTIVWNGDPLVADIKITAIYRLETAPIDLLEQQLAGLSGSELNIYKQRMPFNTILKMTGDLMKPDISFDIKLDEENPSVPNEVIDNTKTKLSSIRNETTEMNKQVFALLLLNRFIGENPFQSDAGMSAETMAKQSVSRILSDQLNNLAGDLIEGVDLNFDFNSREDYSTGQKKERTDLNVSLSKTLFDERLKVTVGNKFGVEGEARTNENMTNIAGDISLDYSLSRDGRYILRAYRKNDYQVALQGQVIETGIGFIITLHYDDFKELFNRSQKKKKERRKEETVEK